MPGAPELDTVLQVGSPESSVDEQDHLPHPAGTSTVIMKMVIILPVLLTDNQQCAERSFFT